MPKGKDVYVVKSTTGKGWNTKADGVVSTRHRTQGAAIDAGKSQAKDRGVDLVVQNRQGQFSVKNSYGNDPTPPKDKR